MADENLILRTSSTTVESDPSVDSTGTATPPVGLTHPGVGGYKPDISQEEVTSLKSVSQDKENHTAEANMLSTKTTMDEPLQDSPVPLTTPEIVQETTSEIELTEQPLEHTVEMANNDNDKHPESPAPDDNNKAVHLKEEKRQSIQAELVPAVVVPNELKLTVSESPRPLEETDQQYNGPHQDSLRSSKPSPVQTESHFLLPDDPLTSSPTASNPNTPPDSQDQMLTVDDVGVGADVASEAKVEEQPINEEALPNPFEFIPPVTQPWYDPPRPLSSSGSPGCHHHHHTAAVQRLPSVLRPANRHHFDTEGSRRASMVAGWDFTPPPLPINSPNRTPGAGQYSPRDRTVSLEGIGQQESYNLPSRPQSSGSWYPQYRRINSQPVYVDTINHYNHPRLNSQPAFLSSRHSSYASDTLDSRDAPSRLSMRPLYVDTINPYSPQRLNSQPAFLSSRNSSYASYADSYGGAADTLESRDAPPEPSSVQGFSEPLPEALSVSTTLIVDDGENGPALGPEAVKEDGNEKAVMEAGDDTTKPCQPDQSKQHSWKFWSRNKQTAQCSSEDKAAETTKLSPAHAASHGTSAKSRLKLKKRLSRHLLK